MNLEFIAFYLPIGGIDPIFLIIFVATLLVSIAVSSTLKRRFRQHSQVPIQYTGAQIAERMLRENGINDVKVIHTPGHLTDHYDPVKKTVNLSESVYHHNSVAAAAVAAHECGHAVQHAKAYRWLTLRSNVTSKAWPSLSRIFSSSGVWSIVSSPANVNVSSLSRL